MKKRLRKKKYLGEFQEMGFTVKYWYTPEMAWDEHNVILYAFFEILEANDLCVGGGSNKERFSGYVTRYTKNRTATEEHRQIVSEWFSKREDIAKSEVDDLTDAWYGWD